MRTPAELGELFRARGLKVTPQRECIFGVLAGHVGHPSAEVVHAEARQRMPMMSLKTVYQTLNDLAAMGEILQLDLGTGAARYDPNVEDQHHHLVCTACGTVRDVHAALDVQVPPSERLGFAVADVEVVFRGLCARCRQGAPAR